MSTYVHVWACLWVSAYEHLCRCVHMSMCTHSRVCDHGCRVLPQFLYPRESTVYMSMRPSR